MSPGFEWDEAKALANQQKHGVSFEEAATVFANPLAAIFDDPDHSQDELREIIVGHSDRNRVLIVSFTDARRGGANHRIPGRRRRESAKPMKRTHWEVEVHERRTKGGIRV